MKRPSAANASNNKNASAVDEDVLRDPLTSKYFMRQKAQGKLQDWVVEMFEAANSRMEQTAIINSVVQRPKGKKQYQLDTENPSFKDEFLRIVRILDMRNGRIGNYRLDIDNLY